MSKLATRHNNFKHLRAERANGAYEGYVLTPELFATLAEQYRAGRARIKELSAKKDRTPGERREMENHIRIVGSWAKNIRELSQKAFENAFIIVAQARLPKEHFLLISDEARALWRLEGFADGLPVNGRSLKKAIKHRRRRAAITATQEAK